ncbi:hypothetical protein BJ322DRAFT_1017925 [Thelephora terrestris]|uniref:Uncharacterized protein n=1 Tax=Thelephora terrestris TaxID=56493 RepID=A0A9P6HKK4_9AGAM|nr:hypothetical protein BJ322DRAFT_1017925 [Thelephora terrestris]
MQLRDPTTETEPNYEDAVWDAARNAIMAGGKSLEETLEILRQGWRGQHKRAVEEWNEHLRLHQQQEREQEGEGDREQVDLSTSERNSESEVPDWVSRPTPSFLDIKPARNILKRLEKKEFVELWYFTADGCRETSGADLLSSDDYNLVGTGNGRIVLRSKASAATSTKAVKDEDLSWEQLTEAKTRMVGCMKACGWSQHEVTQLVMFFLSLDDHPIRSQSYRLQTIMRYQDRVRRDWTSRLKTDAYSISEVNDNLMKEFRDDIRNEVQAKNNSRQEAVLGWYKDKLDRGAQRPERNTYGSRPARVREAGQASRVSGLSRQTQAPCSDVPIFQTVEWQGGEFNPNSVRKNPQ